MRGNSDEGGYMVDASGDGVVRVLRRVSNKVQWETTISLVCPRSKEASWCSPSRRTKLGGRWMHSVDDGFGAAGQGRGG
jgi:hypothetical protein